MEIVGKNPPAQKYLIYVIRVKDVVACSSSLSEVVNGCCLSTSLLNSPVKPCVAHSGFIIESCKRCPIVSSLTSKAGILYKSRP